MGGAVSLSVGYPGPRGSHSDAAAVVLAPGARTVDLPSFTAVVEAAGEAEVDARRAADRELADRPDRRDARPALRGAALDRPRGDAADRALRRSGSPGASLDRATIVRSHPAAFDQCRDLLRATRRCSCIAAATTADAAREVAEPAIPPQVAIASAEAADDVRARGDLPTTSATAPGVHTLRRARAVHAGRARRGLADGALVRHRPPPRCALPRTRRVRPRAG